MCVKGREAGKEEKVREAERGVWGEDIIAFCEMGKTRE